MFCSKCGAEVPEGAQFCSKCGNNQFTQQAASQPQTVQQQYQQPVQQIIQPQTKSKIAVGMVAGVMFFLGMLCNFYFTDVLTYIPFAALAVYVIRQEDNVWLKKCAVRAIGTVVMFSVLTMLVLITFRFINIFEIFASWGHNGNWTKVDDIRSIILIVVSIIQEVFLFVMGVQAFGMKTVKVPIVDGLIQKYMA